MNSDKHLKLIHEARNQYYWYIANTVIALVYVVMAAAAFMFGHVIAGVLTLIVSVLPAINAQTHKRRGDICAGKADETVVNRSSNEC